VAVGPNGVIVGLTSAAVGLAVEQICKKNLV